MYESVTNNMKIERYILLRYLRCDMKLHLVYQLANDFHVMYENR